MYFVHRVLSQEPNKLICSQLCGFMAQLVEHCIDITEVKVPLKPPVWEFFRCLYTVWDSCLNCPDKWEGLFYLTYIHLCLLIPLQLEFWKWSFYDKPSAGNNSRSSDIVRPNFENVRPISHYDRTQWPNMSPAHLEFSSSKCCQSINYVRSNLSNVLPKGRFERTYVLWIKKNYFQHCKPPICEALWDCLP